MRSCAPTPLSLFAPIVYISVRIVYSTNWWLKCNIYIHWVQKMTKLLTHTVHWATNIHDILQWISNPQKQINWHYIINHASLLQISSRVYHDELTSLHWLKTILSKHTTQSSLSQSIIECRQNDRDFLIRMLYKNCYWFTEHLTFLILNLHMCVLYSISLFSLHF